MRQRQGFVSNSSSCNFVVIYRPVSVKEKLDKKYDYVAFGQAFDGGVDMFNLTHEMIDLLNKDDNRLWADDLELTVGELIEWAECSIDLTEPLLKHIAEVKARGDIVVKGGEHDQNSTDDIEDFRQRYITGEAERND